MVIDENAARFPTNLALRSAGLRTFRSRSTATSSDDEEIRVGLHDHSTAVCIKKLRKRIAVEK